MHASQYIHVFIHTYIHTQVGDILLQGERGAHVIVHPEVAEYVMTSLAAVRSAPVKNTAIPLNELGVRPPVTKEVSVEYWRACVYVSYMYVCVYKTERGPRLFTNPLS